MFYTYIVCMKSYSKNDARTHCANWDVGDCLGCMMPRMNGELVMVIDSKLKGKSCSVDNGCEYFEKIVVPSIENQGR